jgi:hypothetical protein
MSASIIVSIHASLEIPKIPPQVFEPTTDSDSIPSEVVEVIATESLSDPTDLAPGTDGMVVEVVPSTSSADPDLWLYRQRTVALLRRYLRLSIEVGRMPSLLGREFFRTRVTSYKASTFEDSVIFVHDMERTLEGLDGFQKQLIAKIVLQEYSKEEAGRLLGCGYRSVERLFPEALDRVSELLLQRGILTRLPRTKKTPEKSCQGGQNDEISPSY